jgi:hypothetical protein
MTHVPSGIQNILCGKPLQLSKGLDPKETPSTVKRCNVVTLRFNPILVEMIVSQAVTTNPWTDKARAGDWAKVVDTVAPSVFCMSKRSLGGPKLRMSVPLASE